MPELPEVETVRRGLSELIIGKIVAKVSTDNQKSFPNSQPDVEAFLLGAKIIAVRRRAKVLMIDLNSGYTLVIHLKMTGQLVYVGPEVRFGAGHPNESLVGGLPDKSTRVEFAFADGSNMYFNDQRKFGWVRLMPSLEVDSLPFMQKVGPEPFDPEFTNEVFAGRLLRRKNTTIKAAILDQSVLAGVGNIYADEGLWAANIHPETRVKDLSFEQTSKLRRELIDVMALSIEKGGSSNRNYVNADGSKGSFTDFAKVFRRDGLACVRHPDQEIEKIRVAGRGTHICPVCQRRP